MQVRDSRRDLLGSFESLEDWRASWSEKAPKDFLLVFALAPCLLSRLERRKGARNALRIESPFVVNVQALMFGENRSQEKVN